MTVFEMLNQRDGEYSLPLLIHLHDEKNIINLRFITDSEDINYDGFEWKSAAVKGSSNASVLGFTGGGSIELSTEQNLSIDLVEKNRKIVCELRSCVMNDREITEITKETFVYGTVSGSRGNLKFTYDKDDRLSMTFPALIWNNQNNRGNS